MRHLSCLLMVLLLLCVSGTAMPAPITLVNTTAVIGSNGADYSQIGADFDTVSVGVSGSEQDGIATLNLAYSTTFPGVESSGDVTTYFPDVFLCVPDGGCAGGSFTYAIALGDEGANGGQPAGFYAPETIATSASIWGSRTGYIYGAKYRPSGSADQYTAPVVMMSGSVIAGTSVSSQVSDTGTLYNGQALYTLNIAVSGLGPALTATIGGGFDAFWGTGDCANGAFLASWPGSGTLFEPVPVGEPSSLWLAALGFVIVLAASQSCRLPGAPDAPGRAA
jgi:hypothetical protein